MLKNDDNVPSDGGPESSPTIDAGPHAPDHFADNAFRDWGKVVQGPHTIAPLSVATVGPFFERRPLLRLGLTGNGNGRLVCRLCHVQGSKERKLYYYYYTTTAPGRRPGKALRDDGRADGGLLMNRSSVALAVFLSLELYRRWIFPKRYQTLTQCSVICGGSLHVFEFSSSCRMCPPSFFFLVR